MPQVHEQPASNRPSNCTHDSALHRAIYNALSEMPGVPNMAHITANDLKTRGIAAIEASLAGGRTEAVVSVRGTERYVGFRGKEVDADNPGVQIIHRGRYKSLSKQERGWLKRRQAVEPAIGHLKSDHRLDRCWLKGTLGDALHAISCAAGYNLRWLLRAVARLGIGPVLLCLLQAALWAVRPTIGTHGAVGHRAAPTSARARPREDLLQPRGIGLGFA